jgi:hypothetical protein
MNLPQRIAVLIALGVALHVSCQAILTDDNLEGGWTSYAPNSGQMLQSPLAGDKFTTIAEVLIFVVHAGAWLAIALWLLRDRDSSH